MWPLYGDEGRCDDQEVKEEKEEPTRWRGDAGRAYFNDFKALWSRAHDSSLREMPLMEEQDGVIVQSVKMRFCEESSAVWQAVVSSDKEATWGGMVHGVDTDLPSVWNRVHHPKSLDNLTCKEDDKNHLPRPRRRGRIAVHDLRDTVRILERQDKCNGRSAMSCLQDEIRSVVGARLREPPPLPACSVVWANILTARIPRTVDEQQQHLAKTATMHSEQDFILEAPRMIEAPCQLDGYRFKHATKELVVRADQLLESFLAFHTCDLVGVEYMGGCLPSIFNSTKPRVSVVRRCDALVTSTASVNKKVDSRFEERAPKRIKFDGLLKQTICQTPISAMASVIFKSVVKKNASLLFGCAVPGSVSDEINTLMRRASSALKLPDQFDFGTGDGIQLLVLPPGIVKRDDERVEAANLGLQDQGQHVYRSIQLPQISLTSLSLAIPSVWRHARTIDVIQHFKLQLWALPDDCDVGLEEAQLIPVNDDERSPRTERTPLLEVVAEYAGRPDGGSEPKDSRVMTVVQDKVTEPPPIIPPLTSKRVTFKIQDSVSTDDLVTSFLGVDLSETPQREEPSKSDPSTCAQDLNVLSTNGDPKLTIMIDQLARPAVWFLVRLKMLKVNSTSKLDGLRSIQLEVLDTIARQLHSKLKEVSSNPSKLQSEDIIETCSAFRHAVWLHVLRMIVTCHADSRKSALHVTGRLLESPQYQLSIGAKQTTALSNLYRLMGGSTDTLAVQENHSYPGDKPYEERPRKKSRLDIAQPDASPIRVVCDMLLLERDELLEAMSDLQISVVERQLSPGIDLIVDERNAIVLLGQHHFEEEHQMRALTYELASSQVQFEKLWLIIDDVKSEDALHFFYAALANFTVEVRTFVCKGEAEIGEVIRGIVDACAEIALSQHRILPKMWFARPFMLEEESQLERFLSSTRIVSGFAAQSVLHRLSIADLTTKSLDAVSQLIGSLPHNQVELLWRLFHTSHGIGAGEPVIA